MTCGTRRSSRPSDRPATGVRGGWPSGRLIALLRAAVALVALAVCVAAGVAVARAQAPARSVQTQYADANAKEKAVRAALDAPSPPPTVLRALRTVIADYDNIVRRFPTSGYSDDALWRGAMLARDGFTLFKQAREQAAAVRMLQAIRSEYPTSKFAKQVTALVTQIKAAVPAAAIQIAEPDRAAADSPVATAARQEAPDKLATAPDNISAGPAPSAAAPVTSATAPAPLTSAPAASAATPDKISAAPAADAVAADLSASAPARPTPSVPTPTTPATLGASKVAAPAIPATPATFGASKVATIKDIRRAVLGNIVRVVIELDEEVAFHDERIENPTRVFVDLPATRPAEALKDQTLHFTADSAAVRQVRIGRHPNATTRVVLDADGISSYSVYPLYNPYRLVIDCLQEQSYALAHATTTPLSERPSGTTGTTAAITAPPIPSRGPGALPLVGLTAKSIGPPSGTLPAAATNAGVAIAAVDDNRAELRPLRTKRYISRLAMVPDVAAGDLSAAALSAPALTVSAPAAEKNAKAVTPATAASLPGVTEPARNLGGGFSIARQLGLGVSRIVIDPGHGGHDPGTKGGGVSESELVLDVALRLEKLLSNVPGLEVVLTRRTDDYVPLQERTAIANRESADLFLSIHANASNSKSARGVETYFLNFANNLSAAAVAARENAASGQSMAALPDVVKTIALNNKLDESRDFATYVQRAMVSRLKPANKSLRDLGVKQAPFVVLIGAAMPSVLAEVSFLTNTQEARLLKSSAYRQRIATALFDAVRKYQASLASSPVASR
jgi:N-acetylmuramoyl-L-alanine amidase